MKKERLLAARAIVLLLLCISGSLFTQAQTVVNPSQNEAVGTMQNPGLQPASMNTIDNTGYGYFSTVPAEKTQTVTAKAEVKNPLSVQLTEKQQKRFEKIYGHLEKRMNKKSDVGGAALSVNIFSLLSMIFGILSLFSYYGAFLLGLLAIIFGIIGLNNAASNQDRTFAWIGIITGAIGIILWSTLIIVVI